MPDTARVVRTSHFTDEQLATAIGFYGLRSGARLSDYDIENALEHTRRNDPAEVARRAAVLSVIHPDRPENNPPHHGEAAQYEHRLRIPQPMFSLGWELEANHGVSRPPSGIMEHSDGSVNGDSVEYVVMPAVTKSPRYVLGLLKELVHRSGLNTDDSCGFHVHIGVRNAGRRKLHRWALAVQMFAKEIEQAAFDAVPSSRKENQYCKRITLCKAYESFNRDKYSNHERYNWVNIVETFRPGGIGTVEIRLLGHTHRWKYLLAWVTFCLSLAEAAWAFIHNPRPDNSEVLAHLTHMLRAIALEVRPLEKRKEGVPLWVINALKEFSIDVKAWDRPLSKVAEAERVAQGTQWAYWYNDEQPEIENDEDMDCACGCGTEGRCSYQYHEDGDCNSNDCERCHENGDCGPRCYYCAEGGNE